VKPGRKSRLTVAFGPTNAMRRLSGTVLALEIGKIMPSPDSEATESQWIPGIRSIFENERTKRMTTTRLNETPACGPGCSCGTPSRGRKVRIVVSVIVLLAVASIFVYKAAVAKDDASNNTAAKGGTAFAFAQPAPSAMPGAESQPPRTATPDVAKAGQKVGEYLESLNALNKVAINQDAVLVFIPAPKSDLADAKTNAAVFAVQRILKSNKITLGLYTLQASSPDYSGISAQVQAPAILIACKGKGMAAISGDVTEAKLLQAFMASSRAGGCGPSGCGPSGGACN